MSCPVLRNVFAGLLLALLSKGPSVHGAEFGHLPDNITVLEGESIILRCKIDEEVTHKAWLNRSNILFAGTDKWSLDRRVSLVNSNTSDFSIQIERVEVADEGLYTCSFQASNKPRIAHVFLIVQVPARIVNISQDVSVNEGGNVYLFCLAVGRPEPTVTWKENKCKTPISVSCLSTQSSLLLSQLSVPLPVSVSCRSTQSLYQSLSPVVVPSPHVSSPSCLSLYQSLFPVVVPSLLPVSVSCRSIQSSCLLSQFPVPLPVSVSCRSTQSSCLLSQLSVPLPVSVSCRSTQSLYQSLSPVVVSSPHVSSPSSLSLYQSLSPVVVPSPHVSSPSCLSLYQSLSPVVVPSPHVSSPSCLSLYQSLFPVVVPSPFTSPCLLS
uniref:IgLON family member 5 n=1 Tax=Oncorhynchus mykiss TaxID=8022 RepID=A0A8K9V8Y2_ONCMY